MPDSDGDFVKDLINWITQQGKVSPEVESKRLPPPEFDPVQHRMDTERNLAYGSGIALAGLLVLDFIASALGFGERVDGLMKVAIPTLAGLTGTAFGYYFGKK